MQTCSCNSTHPPGLHVHASKEKAIRIDPTRTATLRKKMIADVNRRFGAIKKEIYQAIVVQDVFGLKESNHTLKVNVEPKQFAFPRSADKVSAFMAWLKTMEELHILTVIRKPGRLGVAAEGAWTDVYIESAYKQGILRAGQELKKAGLDIPIPAGELGVDTVALSFNMPVHADAVGLLYSRTFSELKGITAAMDQQISSILAQGLLEGRNPLVIARQLNERVDKIGITRARTLARTEIVRAHHLSSIQEYENAGLTGVTIQSEWLTAGWNVCPICAPLNGKVFEIQVIKAMIPRHPNCRCAAIPYLPGISPKREVFKKEF